MLASTNNGTITLQAGGNLTAVDVETGNDNNITLQTTAPGDIIAGTIQVETLELPQVTPRAAHDRETATRRAGIFRFDKNVPECSMLHTDIRANSA
jgi:hypothetical protein